MGSEDLKRGACQNERVTVCESEKCPTTCCIGISGVHVEEAATVAVKRATSSTAGFYFSHFGDELQ